MTESVVEEAALEWLEALGSSIAHGAEIGCGQPGAERADQGQVLFFPAKMAGADQREVLNTRLSPFFSPKWRERIEREGVAVRSRH